MTRRHQRQAQKKSARGSGVQVALDSAKAGASWMALLAATTAGISTVHRVRAEVSVGLPELPGIVADGYRLVVQSYSADSVVDGIPPRHVRPLASAQRGVTAGELLQGVEVDVVSLGDDDEVPPVIVAWVEHGAPNLEFDGWRARPSQDAYVGFAESHTIDSGAQARLILKKRV